MEPSGSCLLVHTIATVLLLLSLFDASWDTEESYYSMPAWDKVIFLLHPFHVCDIGIFYEISFCPILDTHPIAISFL